jgi:hypothetical protein
LWAAFFCLLLLAEATFLPLLRLEVDFTFDFFFDELYLWAAAGTLTRLSNAFMFDTLY